MKGTVAFQWRARMRNFTAICAAVGAIALAVPVVSTDALAGG
jgi:hypothetical protein